MSDRKDAQAPNPNTPIVNPTNAPMVNATDGPMANTTDNAPQRIVLTEPVGVREEKPKDEPKKETRSGKR